MHRMAIKKENEQLSAGGEKLDDKKEKSLIRVRHNLKEKKQQKNYEAGVDPQDEQLNTIPEGSGSQRGDTKPGGGNRVHRDPTE
jgi:hypothetical protein